MGVQVQAKGGGGINVGGNLDFGQVAGGDSPAVWSAALAVVLLVIVVAIALSLR